MLATQKPQSAGIIAGFSVALESSGSAVINGFNTLTNGLGKKIGDLILSILDGIIYESTNKGFLGEGSQGLMKPSNSTFFQTPAEKKKQTKRKTNFNFDFAKDGEKSDSTAGIGPAESSGDYGGGGGGGDYGGGGGEGMVGGGDNTVYQAGSGMEIAAPQAVAAVEGVGTISMFEFNGVASPIDEKAEWQKIVQQQQNLIGAAHGH
jgi:hypothetical protein